MNMTTMMYHTATLRAAPQKVSGKLKATTPRTPAMQKTVMAIGRVCGFSSA
jgi:hypothetical protein